MSTRRMVYGFAVDDARLARTALQRGDLAQTAYWLSKAHWALGFAVGKLGRYGAASEMLSCILDGIQRELAARIPPQAVRP